MDPLCNQPGSKFGQQEVQVRVALAMRIGWLINRHVVNERREIRAVIEVEAADHELIRLALPGMDGHDQTRHRLQHLTDAIGWPRSISSFVIEP